MAVTERRKLGRAALSEEPDDGWRAVSAFRGDIDRTNAGNQRATPQRLEAVGRLTGGIAHNFNNILQSVQTYVEMARQHATREKEAPNYLDLALDAVQRGAKLTDQLLTFSRKRSLRPEPVDINRFIERAMDSLPASSSNGLDIEIVPEIDIGTVLVDPPSLQAALYSIVQNSKTAMPDGGRLTIVTRGARLDEIRILDDGILPAGKYVEVRVTDTGCGMSVDILDHAFEPFFTTRDVGEGNGLGLSAVYGFARQSGGVVTLESKVGKGTSVCMLLPAIRSWIPPG